MNDVSGMGGVTTNRQGGQVKLRGEGQPRDKEWCKADVQALQREFLAPLSSLFYS